MQTFCRKTVNEETTDRYVEWEDINVDNEEGRTRVGCTQKAPGNNAMEKIGMHRRRRIYWPAERLSASQ